MTKHEILKYPEIKPLKAPAEKLIVFLHGVGSDGNDLITLAPFMQKSLPSHHFISPHGIERYDMAPFGRQWFSLADRSAPVIIEQAKNNAPIVSKLIEEKQRQLGLTDKDTFIFGFSQGTMIGVYLTLTSEVSYAGMIAFSGRLIPPPTLKNTRTPFCLVHGKEDSVVDYRETEKLADYLNLHNIEHQKLIVPNLDHSIDASGMDFAIKFINK
jgi:phospholipase/carboxylesterase